MAFAKMVSMALTGEGGTTMLDDVMGVIPKLFELGTTCFQAVISNPILLVFVGGSFIGVGFGIFRKMKRAAR